MTEVVVRRVPDERIEFATGGAIDGSALSMWRIDGEAETAFVKRVVAAAESIGVGAVTIGEYACA